MSRARSVIIVLILWGVIYLPRLGSLEIKSEEGRRILPAVTMLETGNYLVPQVGSEPYFRKPPLINWLVAGSFKLFGKRNEWTARLPSVLAVLAVALAFVTIARRKLGATGSLAAAVIWLTNFGLLEKGRLIEIEALYVSLTALAFICWLSWWDEPRSQSAGWILPWLFLGLGLLAKGPLHLLFFYSVVIAVLWEAGELRRLFTTRHLVAVILMLAIFAAWAIPLLYRTSGLHAASVWSRQFSGRLSGEDFHPSVWLLNIPRSVAYLLPWVTLFAFARFHRMPKEERSGRLLSLGIAVPFLVVDLLPGALPRYTMPLLAPAIWLLAIFIRERAFIWPKKLGAVIGLTTATVALGMLTYSLVIIPLFLQSREKVRPIGEQITAALPPNETLYAVDPDYQPYLFYVRRPIAYASEVTDLPANARYLLVQPNNEKAAEQSTRWSPLHARPLLRITDYRAHRVVLLRIGPD